MIKPSHRTHTMRRFTFNEYFQNNEIFDKRVFIILNIGLVYRNEKNIEKEFQHIVDFLKKRELIIVEWRVSLDKNGDKWVEKKDQDVDVALLTKYYYGEKIGYITNFVGFQEISMRISVQQEEGFYGYVLHLDGERLNGLVIDTIEQKIITWVTNLSNFTSFDYAFCDYDSEIEYDPQKQRIINKSYSVLFWPERGSVRKMRIYNAKEIPILKSQISQHQLRNLAFFVAQLKRPLVVYFLLISLLKHNIVFNDRTR